MGCCGQRRAATVAELQAGGSAHEPVPARPAHQLRQPPRARATVALRYLGRRPARARGTASGRLYSFARRGAIVDVETQDLTALLNTGLFART